MGREQEVEQLVMAAFDKPKLLGLDWPADSAGADDEVVRLMELQFWRRIWNPNEAAMRRSLREGLTPFVRQCLTAAPPDESPWMTAIGILQSFVKRAWVDSAVALGVPAAVAWAPSVAVQFLDEPGRRYVQGPPLMPADGRVAPDVPAEYVARSVPRDWSPAKGANES